MSKELDPRIVAEAMRAGKANDGCAFKDAAHKLDDPWDRVELLQELGRMGASDTAERSADPKLGFGISTLVSSGSAAIGQVGGRNGIFYQPEIMRDSVTEKPNCSNSQKPLVSEWIGQQKHSAG